MSTYAPFGRPMTIGPTYGDGYSFAPVPFTARIVASDDANGVIFLSRFNDYGWISPFAAIPIGTTESGNGIKTFPRETSVGPWPPGWYVAQSHLTGGTGYATITLPEPSALLVFALALACVGRKRRIER